MGHVISKIEEIDRIHWTQLRKGRVVKGVDILLINDTNHALVKLPNGSYTVVGGRHSPNGNWAVTNYGLDHFTQAVLHGMVRLGVLTKEMVSEHIATAGERKAAQDRKYNIKRLNEICAELGIEAPKVDAE